MSYAMDDGRIAAFMKELDQLFTKHNMAVVPTYEGSVSFHDPMTVVEYDGMTRRFVLDTIQTQLDALGG